MALSVGDLTNCSFFPSLLCQVSHDAVESLRENLTCVEEKCVQQDYFEYIIYMANVQVNLPKTCEEGLQLYRTLLDIAGEDT